jgi:Transcription factor WhiB
LSQRPQPLSGKNKARVTGIQTASDSGWRRLAACRDEPDDTLFLSDKTLPHNQPGSASVLLVLLICAGCPVRRECLFKGMTPIVRFSGRTRRPRRSGRAALTG